MSMCARFFTDWCSKKKKLKAHALLAQTTLIVKDKIPPKLGDPGTSTIPIKIDTLETHPLLDLGASTNIMSYDFFKKLTLIFFLLQEVFNWLIILLLNLLVSVMT